MDLPVNVFVSLPDAVGYALRNGISGFPGGVISAARINGRADTDGSKLRLQCADLGVDALDGLAGVKCAVCLDLFELAL